MLINSVVDGLKGPLLILVVARWWRPNMSDGGYWEENHLPQPLHCLPYAPSWHRHYKHNM